MNRTWIALAGFALLLLVAQGTQERAASPHGAAASRPETVANAPQTDFEAAYEDEAKVSPEEEPTLRNEELARPLRSDERVRERLQMVEDQIAEPRDGRDAVRDRRVLDAMRAVPRHLFVPEKMRSRAYRDSPLPIGHGQTISQPYIVAYMTEQLRLTAQSKVLEIGTGSGYQAAVLAGVTSRVFTIEILEALAERALGDLRSAGYDSVRVRQGDGYFGWPEEAPFDAIIVTAAAGHLPPPLWEQLEPGGRIVIPIGGVYEVQRLVLLTKKDDGRRESESLMGVRFVPMTGQASRPR
jgi:protein-L-isoaspartate(D-aspartate) O-methyltransferase